jgi:protein SCO1/2
VSPRGRRSLRRSLAAALLRSALVGAACLGGVAWADAGADAPLRSGGLNDSLVSAATVPPELADVGVDEHLGRQLDLNLQVRSHTGATIRLDEVLRGDKPVLFTLNYFTCETLCSLQLNAVLDGLRALDWVPGGEFRVVTLSIDPNEDAALAAKKRATYLDSLGKGEVEWHFLTADAATIAAITDAVGFRYRYDEKTKQFAHPAVVTFLAPNGSVARYLYGVNYPARDLKFALIESAAGRVGSPVEKLILSCFQYDHAIGKYTPAAFGVMRLGGAVSLLCVGSLGFVLWRRELKARANGSTT